jgi:hypothetical protein
MTIDADADINAEHIRAQREEQERRHQEVGNGATTGFWRPVTPGEIFPSGCSYQMNLTTGVQEVWEPLGTTPPADPPTTPATGAVRQRITLLAPSRAIYQLASRTYCADEWGQLFVDDEADLEALLELGCSRLPPRDPRFKFMQFRDIKLDTSPPYRVDGLLPRVGVAIVWGKPKCGKTFWVFNLEMHIALDWPYHGRHVEQGTVLHIACEGANGLGNRKEAWRLHHIDGKTPAEIEEIESAPFYLCRNTTLDLIEDAAAVIQDIELQFGSEPKAVITIDTLNRSLKGSENKDEDMGDYLSAAISLAEKFKCLVLIIHHCGYEESRPRGHSSLIGGIDALIEVQKDSKGLISSEVEEMRDGPNGAKTFGRLLVVEVGLDDNLNPIDSCVIVEDEAAASEMQKRANGKPPSPLAQKYHAALCDALLDKHARKRRESGKYISVSQEIWIRELERLGLVDKETQSRAALNKRAALISKYRTELIAANWAACNGDFIWSIRKEA